MCEHRVVEVHRVLSGSVMTRMRGIDIDDEEPRVVVQTTNRWMVQCAHCMELHEFNWADDQALPVPCKPYHWAGYALERVRMRS